MIELIENPPPGLDFAGTARIIGATISKSKINETTSAALNKSIIALKAVAEKNGSDMTAIPLSVDTTKLFTLSPRLAPEHQHYIRIDKPAGAIMGVLAKALSDALTFISFPPASAIIALSASNPIQFKYEDRLSWDSLANTAYN